MRFLVVQPHHDDAIWSMAETMITWLEDGHQVVIHTVYGGVPAGPRRQKHLTLDQEHRYAMGALEEGPGRESSPSFTGQVKFGWSAWLDSGAAPDERPSALEVSMDLKTAVAVADPDVLVGPIGIHHSDHITTALACGRTWVGDLAHWWYDELPYYVLYPDQALPLAASAGRLARDGCRDHLELKKELCRMYASQICPEVERCIYAPERVWRPL